MARIVLVWGPKGSGKSSFVVSGEEQLAYAELDAGSFKRAYCLKPQLVNIAKFYSPATALEDAGRLSTAMMGASGAGAVQVVHTLNGWREKYGEFINWYADFLGSSVPAAAIDTESKLWLMARNALRQRIQNEVAAAMQADRLRRLEYEEPNSQFHTIMELTGEKDKTLYLVAHQKEQWIGGKPVGSYLPDGWGDIQDEVDIELRFKVINHEVVATIEKGPLGLLDMEFPAPTIPRMNMLLEAASLILENGLSVPDNFTDVIKLGASLE